jgi:hypothetical protein
MITAQASISLFSSVDPSFPGDFNKLLIESVCDLTASLFEDWQV